MESKTLLCKIPIEEFSINKELGNAWSDILNGKITQEEFSEIVKKYMKNNYGKLKDCDDEALAKYLGK